MLSTLRSIIQNLCSSLPLRSIFRFTTLLCGIITNPGHVTDALFGSSSTSSWAASYKWLQEGKWSYLQLARKMAQMVAQLDSTRLFLAVDDTIIYRHSRKAPGSKIHHEHSKKTNRSQYVQGQCLVFLSAAVSVGTQVISLPLISRLTPTISNSGKLVAAKVLWRVVKQKFGSIPCYILMDAWFMRYSLIAYLTKAQNTHVIGQIRKDSAVFEIPQPPKQKSKGRPRKYGAKVELCAVERGTFNTIEVSLYGRKYQAEVQCKKVVVRFLKGAHAKVVWCRLKDPKTGKSTRTKLFLSTDTSLSASEILEYYGRRWSIESLFHQLKYMWGLHNAWQQSRQVFARWVHMLCTAYFVTGFLIVSNPSEAQRIACIAPWRKRKNRDYPLTVGMVQQGLKVILRTSTFAQQMREVAKNKRTYHRVTRRKPSKVAA